MGRRFSRRGLKRKDRKPSHSFGFVPSKGDSRAKIRYQRPVPPSSAYTVGCPGCGLRFSIRSSQDVEAREEVSKHIYACRKKEERRENGLPEE